MCFKETILWIYWDNIETINTENLIDASKEVGIEKKHRENEVYVGVSS
jgi:hypothetical protein